MGPDLDVGGARGLSLSRRDFLVAGAGLFVLGVGGGLGPGAEAGAAPIGLEVFGGYPRALSFRPSVLEAHHNEIPYELFEKRNLPLGGIVGKVLNEAHDHTDRRNFEYFLRYKADHPEKLLLLHYNGTGRRVTDEALTRFFHGHWLYYKGTRLAGAMTSRFQSVLRVEDPSVFETKRYRRGLSDDIAIARLGPDAKPRWHTAEHVRLRSIDRRNRTITVQRGKYGTQARRFPLGSYLAAHVTTGPYSFEDLPEDNIPLWSYNFSTACPVDAGGRDCGDALADYLVEKLGPGGDLESFDGVIFDVLSFGMRFGRPAKDVDVDTDGEADGGVLDGANVVGLGVNRFLQTLRGRLPGKLLLADGHVPDGSQRGFEILNGAESEGYPDKADFALDHASRGENIFDYWRANSAPPSLNYVNLRFKQTNPDVPRNTFIEPNLSEDRSYEKMRLVLASSLFTDSALAFGGAWMPPPVVWAATGTSVKVFDELCKGTEQVPGWLGQPLGPAVHLAAAAPDLLDGQGESWPDAFVNRFGGERIAFSREGTPDAPIIAIRYSGAGGAFSFVLPGLEVPAEDLFVTLRLRAEPLEGFPTPVPRRVDVHVGPAGGVPDPARSEFTWAGGESFEASLYFQDVGPGTVDLSFEVEGARPAYLERMTAHSATDGRYREYEGGVVFANPSKRPYAFDVAALFPGATLRRIRGSARQDPATNDGESLGQELILSARNGLLVVR